MTSCTIFILRKQHNVNVCTVALHSIRVIIAIILILTTFTSCDNHSRKGSMLAPDGKAPILLFNGTGTSPNDVAAIETILDSAHLGYATANSSELNAMGQSQLKGYRLLIIPGGNFIDIGNNLNANTIVNISTSVKGGLNYIGVCAGGFLAGYLKYYKAFNFTAGVTFPFYSAENKGIRKAVVPITCAGAPTLEQYWEDGPQFTGWGAVVGKYPDSTPAIVQGSFGKGWVTLTGVHPEAPEDWRGGMTFSTPASADNAYAAMLIRAALNRVALAYF